MLASRVPGRRSQNIGDRVNPCSVIEEVHVGLKGERRRRVPKPTLHSTDIMGFRSDDRSVCMPEYVEADRLESRSHAGKIEHMSPVVRFVEPAAAVSREHERLAARVASSEPVRLQFPVELLRDRDAPGASLALRLLLAVKRSMTATNDDGRLVAKLQIAPAERLELRDTQPCLGEKTHEKPVLGRRHSGKKA